MRVVAEGIEETAQIERLQQIGCDYGQGYAFGKPTPANEALRIINRPLLPPELHRNRIATNAG
jgi:EAL domain-containing protein (putative c-di-GMP-specific phosphodiesterase class I)